MATRSYAPPLILSETGVCRALRRDAARLLEGVIFFVLLTLIALTAVPYGTEDVWWNSLFQCAVFVLAGLWIVEGLLGGGWLVREHRMLIPLIPLLAFIFFQSFRLGKAEVGGVQVWRTLSVDPFETRLVAFRLLALILVAGMLLRYTSTHRRLRALIYVLIGVAAASAIFGIVRHMAHNDGKGFLLPHLRPQLGFGQFVSNNHFTLLMEMGLGLALGLTAGIEPWRAMSKAKRFRLFSSIAGGVLILSALVLSNSRGGILGLFAEILFFALLFRTIHASRGERYGQAPGGSSRFVKYVLLRPALVMCLLLVIGVGIVWVGTDPLVSWMQNSQTEVDAGGAGNNSCPNRIETWWATLRMIKDYPLGGNGFGGYWLAIDNYLDTPGDCVPQQAHNDFLEIISSGGLLAVVLTVWFVTAVVKRARQCLRRARRSFRRAACLGALAGVCAVAIHSLVDFGLHLTVNALVFTCLIIIATAHLGSGEREPVVDETRQPSLPDSALSRESSKSAIHHRAVRFAMAFAGLLVCAVAIRETAQAGLSRWYITSRESEYSLSSAEQAIRLSPSDPAARFFHAGLLSAKSRNRESLEEFERAVALRPRDHVFWISLGSARRRERDLPGTVAAVQEAVRLAPYYDRPRWQLGKALLRAGQHEQAFVELSRVIADAPEFLPQALDLFWDALDGDTGAMVKAISPQSPATQLALARYFREQGQIDEAIALVQQAGGIADAERRELTAELISAKRFEEAYELWSSGSASEHLKGIDGHEVMTDGSFEHGLDLSETGFGWQVTGNKEGLLVSLDAKEPRAGARSLRLDFKGELLTESPIISQLVFVEAGARYRLGFAAQTQELITAGMPVIMVLDAGSGKPLGQSISLGRGSSGWRDYEVEFVTRKTTSVLTVALRRQKCAMRPCLIFGRLWLDNFSLRAM